MIRTIIAISAVALFFVAALISSPAASAQVPMTTWGKPSLDGTWDFKSATPLSRPERWKDQEFLTETEVAEYEKAIREGRAARLATEGEVREGLDGQADVDVGYNSGFLELGSKLDDSLRTSLIVDPPGGQMPAMKTRARERNKPYYEMQTQSPAGPEMRNLTDRCLIGFNNNPMRSGAYNNIMQIVQSQSHVAIQVEMVNDHRIVPTNSASVNTVGIPASTRFWKGYSSGNWDGDTFVVTTTNFKQFAAPFGTGAAAVLTERFTRLDENTLEYEYTIEDPETYDVPWTARQRMRRTNDDVYEYACHEGNYSMPLVLRAARKLEKEGKTDKTWLPSWYKRRG